MRSIQSRLLASALGVLAAIWLVSAAMIWLDTRDELDKLLDGHLAQAAALLVAQQSQAEGDDDSPTDAASPHRYAPRVAFQVFHHGVLSMRSANAPQEALSQRERGFDSVRDAQGVQWRIFITPGAESDVRILVAERLAARREILGSVARSVLLPLGLALPLLALALWWAVRRGLSPLRRLRQTLEQRQTHSLDPVTLTDPPTEMQPLLEALNRLLSRMAQLHEAERRFTADAAHELRTPIAAIRMQAQVALGADDNPPERNAALQQTLAGCDRATRLVEQLLTLARLEGPTQPPDLCDLTLLTRRVVAELAPLALARRQALALDAPASAQVRADDTLVRILVRNLVDNALRYSPDGACVQARIHQQGQTVWLDVHDSGPGLDDNQRSRLGERFYRALGTGQSGSGLGWSIVQRIAQVQAAQVVVERSESLGGLSVRIGWPAP